MLQHFLLEVPEKFELAEQPTDQYQEHLINGENKQYPNGPINPTADAPILQAYQIGQWACQFCGSTAGNGEDDKNGDHLPTVGYRPSVLELFKAPEKEPYHYKIAQCSHPEGKDPFKNRVVELEKVQKPS